MAENDVIPYKVGDIFVDEETGKSVQAMQCPHLVDAIKVLGTINVCSVCFYSSALCAENPKLECGPWNRPTKDDIYFKEVQECTE